MEATRSAFAYDGDIRGRVQYLTPRTKRFLVAALKASRAERESEDIFLDLPLLTELLAILPNTTGHEIDCLIFDLNESR